MRIYSKVAFIFTKPDTPVVVREKILANQIKDVPDWVAKDLTFKQGKKAGLIEVIENREQELQAELSVAESTSKPKRKKREA